MFKVLERIKNRIVCSIPCFNAKLLHSNYMNLGNYQLRYLDSSSSTFLPFLLVHFFMLFKYFIPPCQLLCVHYILFCFLFFNYSSTHFKFVSIHFILLAKAVIFCIVILFCVYIYIIQVFPQDNTSILDINFLFHHV